MALTNAGKKLLLDCFFRAATPPASLYLALCTATTTPTVDTATLGSLTEIAAGNGYSAGGAELDRNSTSFDTLTEDSALDRGLVRAADVTFTASGGAIPASGGAARYAVLTGDGATVANRTVIAWWDLGGSTTISDGTILAIADLEAVLLHAPTVYLFLDRFETDAAAPLGSPLAADVGEWTLADTGNNASKSGGELVIAGSIGWTPRLTSNSTHVREPGLCAVFTLRVPSTTTGDARVGLDDSTSGNLVSSGIGIRNGAQDVMDDQAGSEPRYYTLQEALTPGTAYRVAIVLRDAGALFLIKGGAEFPEWGLLMVTYRDTESPVHESITESYNTAWSLLAVETALLTGDFTDNYGLATAYIASNTAGESITADTDALIEWTFTAVTGQTHSLEFRRSDADNLWRVECIVSSNLVRLVRRQSAAETVVDTAGISFSSGTAYRIMVSAVGTAIKAWVNQSGLPTVDASSTFNQAATIARASHAGANLAAWPRTLGTGHAGQLDNLGAGTVIDTGGEEPPEPPPSLPGGLWTVSQWEAKVLSTPYSFSGSTSIYDYDHATYFLGWSTKAYSYYHYFLGYVVNANKELYEATGKIGYLNRALLYIYNVIATAKYSTAAQLPTSQYKDGRWPCWVSEYDGYLESILREAMLWRFVGPLLKLMKDRGLNTSSSIYSGSKTYATVYAEVLGYLEMIWDKWVARGWGNIYRSRTHMAAHQATMAIYLWHLSGSAARRTQCLEAFYKFATDLSPYYSSSMRGQLFPHPLDSRAYAWNNIWGRYDLPGGADPDEVDDWGHHQHCIGHAIDTYELGVYWTAADMAKFAGLMRYIVWNGSLTMPDFWITIKPDDIGTNKNKLFDACRLGRFDPVLQQVLQRYVEIPLYTAYLTLAYSAGAVNALRLGLT